MVLLDSIDLLYETFGTCAPLTPSGIGYAGRVPRPSESSKPSSASSQPASKTASRRLPGVIRAAVGWWTAAALVCGAFAVASFLNSDIAGTTSPVGFIGLGLLLSVLTIILGIGAWRLWRGQLQGRIMLTTFGIIGGLPLLFRGPRLMPIAIALLVGVVLLYLPASIRFFKPQVDEARAQRKAARKAEKAARKR